MYFFIRSDVSVRLIDISSVIIEEHDLRGRTSIKALLLWSNTICNHATMKPEKKNCHKVKIFYYIIFHLE